jgi:hypothetical protein
MTIGSVSISIDLDGLGALLGDFGKQPTTVTPQLTAPVLNNVTVAVAASRDPLAPQPALEAIQSTDAASVSSFGQNSAQIVVIVEDVNFARDLAEYLVRPLPQYWFSNIEVLLNGLNDGQRLTVCNLEIGDQIRVSKRFPNVAQPVVQNLFVEGIEHIINQSTHTVRIYTSPADIYDLFLLDVSELDDTEYGLG